jgi:uncharacterized membrane protein YjfL (UPF0719 family)
MSFTLPEHFPGDLVALLTFGILATFLVIGGYKLFDNVITKIDFDEELRKGNLSIAIVVSAFILGLCLVIAAVANSILG